MAITPISDEGLDLTDPDDRAIYRTRVDRAFQHCRVTGIVAHAIAAGAPAGSAAPTRAAAVRLLADTWMIARLTRTSLVQSRRNRETGTTVEVHDLDVPGAPLDRGDGQGTAADREPRWLTICLDHGHLCTHYTRAAAISHASLPSGWCEPCRDGEPSDPECEV